MAKLILTSIGILVFAGGLTLHGLWSIQPVASAVTATKAESPEVHAAPKPLELPEIKHEDAVSTYFTVEGPDGYPCHVKLVQTGGANINLMNLVTDCPQTKGKVNWKSSQVPVK